MRLTPSSSAISSWRTWSPWRRVPAKIRPRIWSATWLPLLLRSTTDRLPGAWCESGLTAVAVRRLGGMTVLLQLRARVSVARARSPDRASRSSHVASSGPRSCRKYTTALLRQRGPRCSVRALDPSRPASPVTLRTDPTGRAAKARCRLPARSSRVSTRAFEMHRETGRISPPRPGPAHPRSRRHRDARSGPSPTRRRRRARRARYPGRRSPAGRRRPRPTARSR